MRGGNACQMLLVTKSKNFPDYSLFQLWGAETRAFLPLKHLTRRLALTILGHPVLNRFEKVAASGDFVAQRRSIVEKRGSRTSRNPIANARIWGGTG